MAADPFLVHMSITESYSILSQQTSRPFNHHHIALVRKGLLDRDCINARLL